MSEDDVRRIVREEIAKAGPVIMARTIIAMRDNEGRNGLGYRSYAMQDGKPVDVTFAPRG